MVTDNYKLVPFIFTTKFDLPCEICPINDICDSYTTYIVYNEIIEGNNSFLDQCLKQCVDDKERLIPILK